VAFDGGFDEFAKAQGFKSFQDYLEKRDICAGFIMKLDNSNSKLTNLNNKKLDVSPPKGYHWMEEDGYYTLMKNPSSGYSQHAGSSLTVEIPMFPVYLPQPKKTGNKIGSDTEASSLEVTPPKGYHWMSNGHTYSLMKTPISGYGPHSGSSLVANFQLYQRQKSISAKNSVYGDYNGSNGLSAFEKASNLLYTKLTDIKAPSLDELFQKIDNKLWNKNICSLKMFIDTQILSDTLESNLTGKKVNTYGVRAPSAASDWGY